MKLTVATNDEVALITEELERGKLRPKSDDFLIGFPRKSVSWYRGALEPLEFENLYLFWDGSAWGRDPFEKPQTLTKGVLAFQQINNDPAQSNNVHLNEIKGWLEKCRHGTLRIDQPLLILGGEIQGKQFIILDGNHRAAAALWWTMEFNSQGLLPLLAWVGLSPDMINYPNYSKILH